MNLRLCKCSDELQPHIYAMDNITHEDGYLCLVCDDFKPLDDEEMEENDVE